jgi:tRNA threonylcarbamoyladenosine biosynthesis protein TsaE
MPELQLTLHDPAATARLGLLLSGQLQAGDVIALEGALGAGKSVLARSIIQAACPAEDDIPSPTFTLVQTYEPDDLPLIMHFDLYRLETPEESLELGIEDAFIDAICLIEWPQRLGAFLPRGALTITLVDGADANSRIAHLGGGARWQPVLDTLRAQMQDIT